MHMSLAYCEPTRSRSCDEPPTNSNLGSPGGPWPLPKGLGGHTSRWGRREQQPTGAVRGGVKERFCRAAQRRRLQDVGHHVREGSALANGGYGSALPAVVGQPVA